MTTIVKAAGAAEFLSLVPRMLGYVPTRSLVMIPFDGSRSVGAMRFDLPGDEPDAVDRVAATVIGTVCRLPDADAVAAITFTDAAFGEENRMPHTGLLRALERRADACGLRLTDALCVAKDGWGSLLDAHCPAGGRPLADLDLAPATDVGADRDQGSGAELPEVDVAQSERVARALLSLDRAIEVLCGPEEPAAEASRPSGPQPPADADADAGDDLASDDADRIDPAALAAVCALDDLPTLFEDALGWKADALRAYDAATLVWCLSRPSLRDIALVQWSGTLTTGDEAFDAQLRWESGEEYPAHLAMRMWGEGEQPDPERLVRALQLSRFVAASAPRASRPGPLAMCAWLSWALGRSTHADLYAGKACDIEPEHGLSEIVRSFVHAGHLPDWAFQRPAR
jgi:hypothetical protein